jgi:hypothetical protein
MTTVDILLHYAVPPSESVIVALAGVCDVYGIRGLSLDRPSQTLRIEYDATRLTAAAVTRLVRQAGLEVDSELSLIPLQTVPEPAPTA